MLALVALIKAQSLAREVRHLRRRVDDLLAGRADAPSSPVDGPAVASAAEESADPPAPAAAPASEPEPQPSFAQPSLAQDEPPTPAADEVQPQPVFEFDDEQESTPPATRRRIDWERWAGVRGAAVLGGIFLALASIFLVKLALEEQWIGPLARCWIGAGLGVTAIALAWRLRRRDFRFAPDALEGGGLVALYAAIWSAHRVYDYLNLGWALVLLTGVTALACALALGYRSRLTALLGLAGGFAAAFLISDTGDQPLSLFGYLLLLDLGLLFVGRRRGWASLGLLALLGTVGFEGLWILESLDAPRVPLALGILGVFAALFALGSTWRSSRARPSATWLTSQAGAVLVPFAFAMHFASRVDFGGHIASVVGLALVLSAAACLLARLQGTPWLAAGAAAGSLAVLSAWVFGEHAGGGSAWKLNGLGLGVVLVFHLFAEHERRSPAATSIRLSALLAAGGVLLLAGTNVAIHDDLSLTAAGLGLCLPATVLLRQSAFPAGAWLALLAPAGVGLGLLIWAMSTHEPAIDGAAYLAIVAALGAALHASARWRGDTARGLTQHGVGPLVLPASVGALSLLEPFYGASTWFPVAVLAPAWVVAFTAGRLGSTLWIAAGALVLLAVQTVATSALQAGLGPRDLAAVVALTLTFGASPWVWGHRATRPGPWISAALVPLAGLPLARWVYVEVFSDKAEGVVYLGLAAATGALGWQGLKRLAGDPPTTTVRAWFGSVALGLAAMALPFQLDVEAPALAFALTALFLAAFARRIDSSNLGRVAAAAGGVATLLLLRAGLHPSHYAREGTWLLSWLNYAHLVPVAALLGAAWFTRRESAVITGLCAVAVLFLWINLKILDVFAEPDTFLAFGGERLPRRDLTTSLAWALYALGLLAAGVSLGSGGLRWTSLLLFLVTVAKVFLYDLGELEGLHRVGSLAGLAVSLILVSLLYQRFVFRREPGAELPPAGST